MTYRVTGEINAERSLDKLVDLAPRGIGQVSCGRIFLEIELCPDNKMDNARVNSVRPVVPQNLNVLVELEWLASWLNRSCPPQPLTEHKVHDASVFLLQLPGVAKVLPERRRDPLEQVQSVVGHNLADLGPR